MSIWYKSGNTAYWYENKEPCFPSVKVEWYPRPKAVKIVKGPWVGYQWTLFQYRVYSAVKCKVRTIYYVHDLDTGALVASGYVDEDVKPRTYTAFTFKMGSRYLQFNKRYRMKVLFQFLVKKGITKWVVAHKTPELYWDFNTGSEKEAIVPTTGPLGQIKTLITLGIFGMMVVAAISMILRGD